MKTFCCVVVEALTLFSNAVENFSGSRSMYTVRTRCHLYCLQTEMKKLDIGRLSSLASMFSIALDSFSDSQNFFYRLSRSKSCIECF